MRLCLPAAARRLPAVVAIFVFALPLAAKDIWDSAPFSADPKEMLAAASAFDPKSSSVLHILYEATYTFDRDGHTKATRHIINRVVTEEGASQVGTVSMGWAPWYEEKPLVEARVISADGAVQYTATTDNRTIHFRTDSAFGETCNGSSPRNRTRRIGSTKKSSNS